MFELGGGSATSRNNNFDRHWRNIRTILNHNPLLHKSRALGDYLLNGTTTHLREGKVFRRGPRKHHPLKTGGRTLSHGER